MKVTSQTTGIRRAALRMSLILSAVTGLVSCDVFEDEGDNEPVQGTYRATVTPAGVKFTEAQYAIFHLNVDCIGDNHPPGCESNPPMWTAVSLSDAFVPSVDDPANPLSFARVFYTGRGFDESSLFNSGVSQVIFKPTNVPEGLKATSASVVVKVYVKDEVSEEAAQTPTLTCMPAGIRGNEGFTAALVFLYKGPGATSISSVALGGADAGSFALGSHGYPTLKSKGTFAVSVTFVQAHIDEQRHATLTVSTVNGASATARLDGWDLPGTGD